MMDFNYDTNMTRSNTSPNAMVTWVELPFRTRKVPSTHLDLDTAHLHVSCVLSGKRRGIQFFGWRMNWTVYTTAYTRNLERFFVFTAAKAEVACKNIEAENKRKKIYIFLYNSGIRDKVLTALFVRTHVFWDVILCRWLFFDVRKTCNIFIFRGSFETSGKYSMPQHQILNSGTLSSQIYHIFNKRCCRSFTWWWIKQVFLLFSYHFWTNFPWVNKTRDFKYYIFHFQTKIGLHIRWMRHKLKPHLFGSPFCSRHHRSDRKKSNKS
jgi:hypothetical protein